MVRSSAMLSIVVLAVGPVGAADMDGLRDSAKWLAEERLRGTLFHNPNVEPLRPMLLGPADASGRQDAPTPITLRGWHNLIILPDAQKRIAFKLKHVQGDTHFAGSIYAVFDGEGAQVAEGSAGPGEEKTVEVRADGAGPHIVLLNSGPASGNAARVTILNSHWAIDSKPRRTYNRTPLHYHFLRDLKLGGFNLAMIDFERLPQEFVTDEGLAAWTELVKRWTDYGRDHELRVMPAINLGGTTWEVEAWGDSPKGLYISHDPEKPLAPCPLQRIYWERILLRRGREIAKLSLDNPYIVGYGIDPEMYQCWLYGHYMLSGTCFCDHCLGGFLEAQKSSTSALAEKKTGKERHEWLKEQRLIEGYYDYLADEMTKIATWCRQELHSINPDLLFNMFVIEIGNWFCEGIARGLSLPDLPIVNFCEHTYYSVGYDSDWLTKIHQRYRDWGANVLQGSAVWDLHFPPTKPGFLAAHAYNLAVNDEGWWYWPGDQLYRDYGSRYAYLDRPAYFEDYWDACVWANREIEAAMAEPGGKSPLDASEIVPWKGKIKRGVPETPEDIMRKHTEPRLPVRVAAPGVLYFTVPERAESFDLLVQARADNNAAAVTVRDGKGSTCAQARGELNEPETMRVEVTGPGTWSVEIALHGERPLTDVGLLFESMPTMLSPDARSLLVPPAKRPGLIGYWPMEEGGGNVVADTSQAPAYNGTMRDAGWADGKIGRCLRFDGNSGQVLVPVEYSYHNLRQFTASAWVRLTGLPVKGNGHSIVNKGPEAPVQHFWWWIGYPPNYALVLEMGSEAHRWGASFASEPLKWELGRWYHVAAVFACDGKTSTGTHYRDGEVVGTVARDEVFHSGSSDLKIGTYGGLHWMHGCIDEVKMWDRALTAQEVRTECARAQPR